MRIVFIAGLIATLALNARAEEKGDLAGKMKEAKVSLEKGIAASKAKGKPISERKAAMVERVPPDKFTR